MSPEGTIEELKVMLGRCFGTQNVSTAVPNVETLGYSHRVPPGQETTTRFQKHSRPSRGLQRQAKQG